MTTNLLLIGNLVVRDSSPSSVVQNDNDGIFIQTLIEPARGQQIRKAPGNEERRKQYAPPEIGNEGKIT